MRSLTRLHHHEVVEVGRNVKDLAVGDHVFVNQGQALRDMRRMATVGGFSNYIRIPQCEVGYSVLKIDNDLPLKTAVLFEPFVIGTRCMMTNRKNGAMNRKKNGLRSTR